MRQFPKLSIVAAILATAPSRAQADVIRYDYGGVITSADPSTGFVPGTRFSGSFAYDPATSSRLEIEGSTSYQEGDASDVPRPIPDSSGLSLQVGGRTIFSHQGGIIVGVTELDAKTGYDNHPNSSFGVFYQDLAQTRTSLGLEFSNPTQSFDIPYQSVSALPIPSTLNLAAFPVSGVFLTGDVASPQTHPLVEGTIDTLSLETPEPTAFALLGLTALGRLWWTRRRRTR